MNETTAKLENVCQHGFWVGQGAAPCPFCHPECYATAQPIQQVVINVGHEKDLRIAELEAENERLRDELSDGIAFAYNMMEPRTGDDIRDTLDEQLHVLEANYKLRGSNLAAERRAREGAEDRGARDIFEWLFKEGLIVDSKRHDSPSDSARVDFDRWRDTRAAKEG